MSTLADERIKLVGDILPYVFIESVAIDSLDSMRAEDRMEVEVNSPVFIKNEFGNNKLSVAANIEESGQGSVFSATVTVSVNDFLKNSVWFKSPIRQLIGIKLLYATSQDAFNFIKGPSFRNIKQIPSNLRSHVGVKTLKMPMFKNLEYYKTRQIDSIDDILCTIKLKETLRLKTDYLAFVAFPLVEAPELYGVKAVRKVLADGQVESRSTTYYNPDGSIWSGPVHIHPEKGVMAGKKHSARKHDLLEIVEHENTIKDFRTFKKFEGLHKSINLSKQGMENKTVFSDLMFSPDPDGNIRGLFVFDMIGFLAQKSEFNNLINKRNRKKILRLSNIRKLRVIRKRINDFESGEHSEASVINNSGVEVDIIATFDDGPGRSKRINRVLNVVDTHNDKLAEKEVGSLSEVLVSGIGDKRAFSFVDLEMASIQGGTYTYGVEIDIKDPTLRMLETQIVGLREASQILLSYYEEANSRGNYNSKTDELSTSYLQKLKTKNNLSIKIKGKRQKPISLPWRIAARMYFDSLETLLGRTIPKRDKKNLQKLLYPSTNSLVGVERFLKLLTSLQGDLQKYQVIRRETSSKSAGVRGLDSKTHIISTRKDYANKPWRSTRYNRSSLKLDYFGDSVARTKYGLSRIGRNSLIKRFNLEATRLFPQIDEKGSQQVADPFLKDYRKVYFSFLTPTIVLNRDEKIILSDKDQESYKKAKTLLKAFDLGTAEQTSLSTKELLFDLGAIISNRNKKTISSNKIVADSFFGENTNIKHKPPQKDSQRDVEGSAGVMDAGADEIRDALLGRRSLGRRLQGPVLASDSLQKRYIKQQQAEVGKDLLDDRLTVIQQTEASIKYIIGFDRNMVPIYSKTVPHTPQPCIYVLDLEKSREFDMGEVDLISDSVGFIYSSGDGVSTEQMTQQSRRTAQELPEATSAGIPTQDPCPVGYRYDDFSESCVLAGRVASVRQLDSLDSPTQDVEPSLGQTQVIDSVMPKGTGRGSGPQPTQTASQSTVSPSVGSTTAGGGSYGY
mgnify:FL=1|tara:strand:+ start:309 stop:3353 length:3045 start_codon:yes stop_codon:yes gene_type:complete